MKLPGVLYIAIIEALLGLLQGDWFHGQLWVPAAVMVLGMVAKLIEVYATTPTATRAVGQAAPSKLGRWLLGG